MMKRAELTTAYAQRYPHLIKLAKQLEDRTKEALVGIPHIDRIAFRAKEPKSYLDKVFERKKNYIHPLDDVEDQIAGRVLVLFLSDIPIVEAAIKQEFAHVESVRKEPKHQDGFGYESHHLVLLLSPLERPRGKEDSLPPSFELQIRTLCMHAWAEPQHKLDYKGAALTYEAHRELASAAAMAWGIDRSLERVRSAMVSVSAAEPPET